MTGWQLLVIFVAGIAAGTINTVVGSGTLITFPVLLGVGLPPVTANVTNTVGLVFGSITGAVGYRAELSGQRRRLVVLGSASLLGGTAGAIALLTLPAGAFKAIVPVLIVIALVLVVVQPRLAARLAKRERSARLDASPLLWVAVLATGIYGGYFGAAQGVLLMAVMGVLLDEPLQRINATKNVLAALVNGIAAIIFIATAHIEWSAAGALALGAILGGLLGARIGRRLSPRALQGLIVVIGLVALVKLLF